MRYSSLFDSDLFTARSLSTAALPVSVAKCSVVEEASCAAAPRSDAMRLQRRWLGKEQARLCRSPRTFVSAWSEGVRRDHMIECELRDLPRGRHKVVLETSVQKLAVLVVGKVLEHGAADAVRQSTNVLSLYDTRVEYVSTIMDTNVLEDLESAGFLVDLYYGHVDAVGEAGEHCYPAALVSLELNVRVAVV